MKMVFGFEFMLIGIGIVLLIVFVIFGGICKIVWMVELIVFFMVFVYLVIVLFVVVMNYEKVFDVISLIFKSVFGL